MKKLLMVMALVLVITGCGKKKIDVKIESIEVPTEKIYIEFGEKHTVNYKIKPDNAINKKVKITSEKGLLSNDDNPEEFQAINNEVHGDDQICITSADDDSIKACYDVYVKPKPFSQKMEGFTRSGYVYTQKNGPYTYELNVSEGYLKSTAEQDGVYLEYKYYYRKGYGESVQMVDGYTIKWVYREDTNRATCSASSHYNTFCNYTSESGVINAFSTTKEYANLLIGDYSDEELLT